MKAFEHLDAQRVDEASSEAKNGAVFIAGGTDLLGTLKDEIMREYPKRLVNLKTIEGLDYIKEEDGLIKIGAMTKVDALATSELVKEKATCLAQAAQKVSSPTIRKMATIGGNVCQQHRCWYFRNPRNRFDCFRKGGDYCPAMLGDNRYHSILGEENGCIAVNPQDSAPALIALNATIVTNNREIAAEEFFHIKVTRSNILEDGEVVTELKVPVATKSAFMKNALRKTIDFALVNCAVAETDAGIRVAVGGVYPSPIHSEAAEAAVEGGISEDSAAQAGEALVAHARPFPKNAYKVEIAKTVVKRTLLQLM